MLSWFASATGRRMAALRIVWGSADLRNLELAWLTFNVAEYAFVVGIGVYAFESGGAVAVGVVTLIRTAPALVSGPIAAVFTDRLRRERVMRAGLLGRVAASAVIVALLQFEGADALVYLFAAVDTVAGSLFWPAHTALIPELGRSANELTATNAVSQIMENLGTLIGPAVAAVALAMGSLSAVFSVGLIVLIIGVVAAGRVSSDRIVGSTAAGSPLADALRGLRYVRRHRDVRAVVGLWTLEASVVGMTEVFVVLAALEITGMGDPGVGILNASLGMGGLLGAMALTTVRRGYPFGRFLGVALALYGTALVAPGLGVGPPAVVALLAFAFVGVAQGFVDVSAQTLLQRLVPEDYLGRVLGSFEGLYWGALGAGALVASLLAVWLSTETAIVATGVVLLATAAAGRATLRRVDHELEVPVAELELLESVPGLDALPVPTLEFLVRTLDRLEASVGEHIVIQGETGDRVYIIERGSADVVVDGLPVASLEAGDAFGEIALVNGQPRMASVVITEPAALLALHGDVYLGAVTGHVRSEIAVTTVIVARLAESARVRRKGGVS